MILDHGIWTWEELGDNLGYILFSACVSQAPDLMSFPPKLS